MESKAFKVFLYVLFTLLALIMLYPFWYSVISSISPYSEIMQQTFPILPGKANLDAYKYIIEAGLFNNAFRVTIIETFAGTAASMLVTIGGAYVLSLEKLPGRKIINLIIIFTLFFSGGLIPTYILLSDLGITNTIWVYILPGLINTFYMFIIRTSFQDIPKELREAAEIDGASELRILFQIYIPLCKTTLLVIGLFYMVDKWNDLYTSLYYCNYENYTLQAVLYDLLCTSDSPFGTEVPVDEQVKHASIIVTILPMIVIYPFLQKYFTKGVLLGSVKE